MEQPPKIFTITNNFRTDYQGTYIVRDNKVYNQNGDVAILVAPNYGAGWYSWNRDIPECLTHSDIVKEVLNGTLNSEFAETILGDTYWSTGDVTVKWIKPGRKFRIHEYDGAECIVFLDEENYLIA